MSTKALTSRPLFCSVFLQLDVLAAYFIIQLKILKPYKETIYRRYVSKEFMAALNPNRACVETHRRTRRPIRATLEVTHYAHSPNATVYTVISIINCVEKAAGKTFTKPMEYVCKHYLDALSSPLTPV